MISIVIGVVVVAALAFFMSRSGSETATPEPSEAKAEPPVRQVETPKAEPKAKEALTLIMSPKEAQAAASDAMASSEPTVVPEGQTEKPTSATELQAEPENEPQTEQEPQVETPTATKAELPAGGSAVLALLDVSGENLSSPNRAALSAASQLAEARGVPLHICCLGADTQSAAHAGLEGATVHSISDESLADRLSETYTAAALSALAAIPADAIVGAASTIGKGFLPRLAEALGCGMVSEILSVESADTFTRALWAGSTIATVKGEGRLVISVRATGFDPAQTSEASPQSISFQAPPSKLRFVERQVTSSARPDLSEASVVVSGGRGTKGDFAPIEELADALAAGMGASRAACDAGWVPNDLQVGQTGKVVAPNLYFAIGISGAIQHIAGMKGSKTIVAINKDADAPIFGVADYGLVADLFDACPELAQKVASQGLKPTA